MNTCNVAKDLIPLYAEGLTNEDSTAFVEKHIAECAECRRYYELVREDFQKQEAERVEATQPSDTQIDRLIGQIAKYQNKIKLAGVLAAMLLTCVFTGVEVPFLSTIPLLFLTPFFCRLFYGKNVPILLSALAFGITGGALSEQGPSYVPFFAGVAFVAACVGVGMAVLMKRGMAEVRLWVKTALIVPAVAVMVVSCIGYFSFFGNPAGYVDALVKTQDYVSENYEEGTLRFVGVGYNFKFNVHYGKFEYVLNGSRQVGTIEIYRNGHVYDSYKDLMERQFTEERSEAMRAWVAAAVDYAPVAIAAGTEEELLITRDELNESYYLLSYDLPRRDKAAELRKSEAGKLEFVISLGEFADEPDAMSPDEFAAKVSAIRDALTAHDVPFRSVEVRALDMDGNVQRLRIEG